MTKTKELKNKNILYVTHTYNNFIKFQVEILAKQFNHVYVLMRHKPVTALKFLLPIQDLRFHSLEYKIDLKNKPENVTVIPTPIWYLPFNWFYKRLGPWHAKAVLKAVRKFKIKFDVVHAHMLWSAGYAGMQIAKEYNVPFVVTGHGSDVYVQPFKDNERRKKISEVLKYSNEIITVSQNNLRIIQSLVPKKKVHVIPNGFNEEKYNEEDKKQLREELGLPLDKKIFVTVSNLEKVKGNHILIQAIKEVVSKTSDAFFVLVGGGHEYNKIKKEIRKLGIDNCILMTNFQPHEKVLKYELASDFFVLASLNEGVPTVLFEALASGLPFIGTKVGGIPEYSRNFSSILVEPNDVSQLSDAILKSMEIKWDRKKIIEYSKEYTWENVCKKIQVIYENCVKI